MAITPYPRKSFLPHWRTDPKEIARLLEAAGWRVYKRKPSRDPIRETYPGYDFVLEPRRKLRPIVPGAQRAWHEVLMGRPAPKREIDR
jgi:hypothetical protein